MNTDVRTPIVENGGGWVEQFGAKWEEQVQALKSKFAAKIEKVEMPGADKDSTDVPVVWVTKGAAIEVISTLKSDPLFQYDFLSDITATDEMEDPNADARFVVVYQFYSMANKNRIRVKVKVRENDEPDTLIPVWPGANWAEREVYDMFGIKFKGHPDMRRILMDVRFKGHPLRKDYPLRGYQLFPTPMAIEESLLGKEGVT